MQHVICDRQGEVAFIRMNRPEVHNAFNDGMILEMTDLFRELSTDDAIRVIVLAGEGKSFCAGADLNWMKRMKDYTLEQNMEDSRKLAAMYYTINDTPKPVVGCVHGAAMGGGVGLVAVCDYVIANRQARFGLPEVQLGLAPAVISPFVIAKIGESCARAWMLSGNRFGTEQAEHMGLVHEIAEDTDDLQARTQRVVQMFLRAAPHAIRATKRLIAEVPRMKDRKTQVLDTSSVIAHLRVGAEGQEGMQAALNKTKPSWDRG